MKPTKYLLARNYLFAAIAVSWTLLIAVLCLISFNKLPTLGISVSGADKYVHGIFHFGFTVFWFLAFRSAENENKKVLLRVFGASVFYGILIEIAQGLFTTTRQADIYDVMANTSGAVFAVILICIVNSYRDNK